MTKGKYRPTTSMQSVALLLVQSVVISQTFRKQWKLGPALYSISGHLIKIMMASLREGSIVENADE